jgi:hypothetical protein
MGNPRNAVRILALCAILCATGTIPAHAKGKTACGGSDSNQSGGSIVTTVPLRVGGRLYRLETRTTAALGGKTTSSFTVSSGHRQLFDGEAVGSPDGFTVKVDLGIGLHGLRRLELTSTDGRTVAGTADGRALAPFPIGGVTSPEFADGGKVPKLKMKPLLRRVLSKLATCAGGQPSVRPRALLSSCDTCNVGCALAFAGCGVGTLLSAAAGVGIPTLALNIANCEDALFKCASACAHGKACCPVPCAAGHGIALGNNVCEATCSEDAVCCGGAGNPSGQCCGGSGGAGSFCCGATCLDAGDRCINPAGAYCFGGTDGDVCADASTPGPVFCCGGSEPVCRDSAEHVCCSSDAGELCDIEGKRGCCPSDHPFCSKGTAAGCCDEPVCCDPPSSKCGSTCCNPLTEVCIEGACVEPAPDIVIDQPADGAHLYDDTSVTLSGHVFGGTCTSANGHWKSNVLADEVPASGCTVVAKFHGTGARTLTLTVTSPGGTPGSKSVSVTIDLKPAVTGTILAPPDTTAINLDNCDDVLLEASATGAPPLTLTWIWQADQLGCAPFTIPTSCPITNITCTVEPPPDTYVTFWHSCQMPEPPCEGTGKIRLQVTDDLGRSPPPPPDDVGVSLVRNPH